MIKILQPDDRPLLEPFLQSRLDSSMFLLGNMRSAGLHDQGEPYQGTYAAAFEDGEIIGVVGHFWNGSLILQAPEKVVELCQAAARASKRGIKGLIGPNEQVECVKSVLSIDPSKIQLAGYDKLYSLPLAQLAIPDMLQKGHLQGRRITEADLEIVSAWEIAYSIETLGENDSPALHREAKEAMERSLKRGHTWILEAEGQPVARTSFNTTIQEAVQIGGVYTPPEFRSRGYGRAVVAASLRDAMADGAEKAILFTAEENIAAQKAYISLGFNHIGEYQLFLLHSSVSF